MNKEDKDLIKTIEKNLERKLNKKEILLYKKLCLRMEKRKLLSEIHPTNYKYYKKALDGSYYDFYKFLKKLKVKHYRIYIIPIYVVKTLFKILGWVYINF